MPIVTTQWSHDQSGAGAARLVSVGIRRPSWAVRTALLCAAVFLAAAAMLIVIPLVLAAGLLLVAVLAAARLLAAVTRLRAPNGPLDSRRNVRVVMTDDPLGSRSAEGAPAEDPWPPAARS